MKKINQASAAILVLFLFSVSVLAQDSLAVVVNKANPVDELSRSELIDLFMGKYVAFPNNVKAIPVELNGDHKIKVDFYKQLVDMPLSQVNAYWSRLLFTGRKRSAIFQSNETELIAFIIANEQAIGYLPQSLITDELKVVYILHE
jgi:ABC-type phosphate transport system substrate-binding protein